MTTQEIANKLVAYCRAGEWDKVYQELFSPEVWSIEPDGTPNPKVQGIDEIYKKGEKWNEMVQEVHATEISDPIVADKYFAITMNTRLTFKGAPGPINMEEICLYHVQDGKVVSEQFYYTPEPAVA